MTPYIEQCKAAMDELLSREHSHIMLETYSYRIGPEEASEFYSYETLRNGDNYMLIRSMEDYMEDRTRRWGDLLLGNVAININSWIGDDVMQGALKIAEKAARGKDLSSPSDRQKILAALARRGYDFSVAKLALKQLISQR